MKKQFNHQLEAEFNRYEFPLTPEQTEQLTVYRSELKRWNTHINLTALRDDAEIIQKHFLDSISVLEHCAIEGEQTVIDIGTGAGFPGVVLKIYIPNIRLTLVEASQKKVAFLKYLISQLGLDSSIQVLAERAEICAESDTFVNVYDWVLTRYVASLVKSATYCLPLLNATGRWIAYKSSEKDVEIRQSRDALQELGGEIEGMYNSRVAQLNRCYIVVRRVDSRI
jgi:16S rRNA (guanine527-N7)-methyltransferase